MTHSKLTNQVKLTKQQSSRQGAVIDTFLIHHQAGTSDDAVIKAMQTGSREVSANYTISNEGRLTSVVPEQLRAWTSGSSKDGGKGAAWDRRSITVEIENESGAPNWKISTKALQKAAALLNDLRSRYKITHVLGHRDLWLKYKASYATYCPGPNTVAAIVKLAAVKPPVKKPAPAPTYVLPNLGPVLKAGAVIRVNQYLSAGNYKLILGNNSIMALYLRSGGVNHLKWFTSRNRAATVGDHKKTFATLQKDGNFVVYGFTKAGKQIVLYSSYTLGPQYKAAGTRVVLTSAGEVSVKPKVGSGLRIVKAK